MRLRPLMADGGSARADVVLWGTEGEEVTVDRDTELEVVIVHHGREMTGLVTPGELRLRPDGLLVHRQLVPFADIIGMEGDAFSPGRTVGLILGCLGGAIVVGFVALVLRCSGPGA